MSDPQVQRWRQRGAVYLWRYRDDRRNYSGWNLSAEEDGCASLLELFDLMIAGKWSSQASIQISEPTVEVLRAVGGPESWSAASVLILHYPKAKVEPGHWSLVASNGRVTITVGEERLAELRRGLVDVGRGEGDWAAPNDDDAIEAKQLLYFWPRVWTRYSSRYGR